jgi:hypothetical protein
METSCKPMSENPDMGHPDWWLDEKTVQAIILQTHVSESAHPDSWLDKACCARGSSMTVRVFLVAFYLPALRMWAALP